MVWTALRGYYEVLTHLYHLPRVFQEGWGHYTIFQGIAGYGGGFIAEEGALQGGWYTAGRRRHY
jgi:PII-like signaling protein